MATTDCKCKCLLISLECLFNNTPLNTSLDLVNVEKSVRFAQEFIIKEIIRDCYLELCTEVEANKDDLSKLDQKWKDLKDTIELSLAWWSYYYYLVEFATAQLTKKGLVKKSSENSDPIEDDQLIKKTETAKAKAESLNDDIKFFLRKNNDTYDCCDFERIYGHFHEEENDCPDERREIDDRLLMIPIDVATRKSRGFIEDNDLG